MGGHGGLNILPQKRWNVYNFENRERVRKDEEEASRQEQAEQHKAQARDAEFRMEKLREAARLKKQQESHVRNKSEKLDAIPEEASGVAVLVASVDQDAERPQHINLFAELEAKERDAETKFSERRNCSRKDKGDGLEKKGDERGKRTRKGKDEDALKADENERYRLGHGSYGKSGKRPWYMAKSSLLEDEDAGVQRQNIPSGTSFLCFNSITNRFALNNGKIHSR
ncbi:hypothetical protein O6H91_11G100600 [Diphasiastrum complanatum]|uniref:Uncharacterized protein n=1 Tax=Diphasiastrum complanatum TaxID=34168 RepID=A0ACC2CBY6_DIPCM|nr:hypothetical protein O6H91_11G100600 [Diphasiastrum complanatum]